MPYKTFTDGQNVTAADMNAITADPVFSFVSTNESTGSSGYTDLATSGPSITTSLVTGQKVLVEVACHAFNSAGPPGHYAWMSFEISGPSSLAADDNQAVCIGDTVGHTANRPTVVTVTGSGLYVFTAKYRTNASGDFATFNRRYILVKPF